MLYIYAVNVKERPSNLYTSTKLLLFACVSYIHMMSLHVYIQYVAWKFCQVWDAGGHLCVIRFSAL